MCWWKRCDEIFEDNDDDYDFEVICRVWVSSCGSFKVWVGCGCKCVVRIICVLVFGVLDVKRVRCGCVINYGSKNGKCVL